jgi:choline-phosphate cytidylyltransferase
MELSKELRQLWTNAGTSTPSSPAVGRDEAARRALSPNGFAKSVARLDIPRPESPGGMDFATGYSLGLIGGVRSWVCIHQLFLHVQGGYFSDIVAF